MKKIIVFITLMLFLGLSACGNNNSNDNPFVSGKVYSFEGENEYVRIINGSAYVGGSEETFDGGTLELKSNDLGQAKEIGMRFYILDENEDWTIIESIHSSEDGILPSLENSKLASISGSAILNQKIDLDKFEHDLYFELKLTDEKGDVETYTIPMVVSENNS